MAVGAYYSLDCVDKYLTFVGNILWHMLHWMKCVVLLDIVIQCAFAVHVQYW